MTANGKLPPGWRRVKLGDVAAINPRRPPNIPHSPDTPTTFVPMASVKEDAGGIAAPLLRPFAEISKGYTYFEEGDVLFAKITPCMQNGKHAIARGLSNGFGFGTTEFHVIRPGERLTPEWIHLFVRQPRVLKSAVKHFRGAVGQQRVPKDFLANLEIPLPSVDEQQRIAARLNEQLAVADKARKAAEELLDDARSLPNAFLREALPLEGQRLPRNWRWVALRDIATIDYGYTASSAYGVCGPRFLRITDIQDGQVDWQLVPFCEVSQADEAKKRLEDGDIVLARTGGTTGKSFLVNLPPRAVFASYLLRARADATALPKYLSYFFRSDQYWEHIRNTARGGAQPNVNARLLGNLRIPLPPLAEQKRIVARLDEQAAAEQARRAAEATLSNLHAIPSALLRRALAGAS